ncbi:hypothetical protein DVH05_000739 [Phytophthora capsici]|nr:hypothetical protein DVH05_000739 [Phytophthora capsici]
MGDKRWPPRLESTEMGRSSRCVLYFVRGGHEASSTAEYKLYRFNRPRGQLPAHIAFIKNPNEPPVSIAPPRTEVHFDARTLLGLEPGDPLPRDPPNNGAEFPGPLVVDLYQVPVRAQRLFNA